MSYTTGITFACDRCGRHESPDYDTQKSTADLPIQWRRVTIVSPSGRALEVDLCNDCAIALTQFLEHTPLVGEGTHGHSRSLGAVVHPAGEQA
jgi:hypothetical protein